MGWQDHRQTNFACNSIGPNFNKPRKRCNSNDANSIFEQAAGELHAKLTGRQRGRAAAETASRGPLHPLRGATPDQKGCTAYRSGAAQPVTRTNAESARTQAWLRCPRWFRDQRGHRMQFKNTSDAASQTDTNQHNVGGELHAKLLWPGRRRSMASLRDDAPSHTKQRPHRCGGRGGPGRASRRRAERSSRRGRLAGGPPPTGAQSSPAPQPGPPAPGTPVGHQAARPVNAYKNAHPEPGGRI